MPRANRHRLPWRWRIGVLETGLGLILWPAFYARFGHLDLGNGVDSHLVRDFLHVRNGNQRIARGKRLETARKCSQPLRYWMDHETSSEEPVQMGRARKNARGLFKSHCCRA